MQRSCLFERIRDEAIRPPRPPKEEHQQSAKLHCLYGCPIFRTGDCQQASGHTYPLAVSRLFDIRLSTQAAHFGPFLDDGSDGIDWEKVEAIIIVLGAKMRQIRVSRLFPDICHGPFSGSWAQSFVPPPEPGLVPSASDPYGVTGTWYRALSSIDFMDFLKLNFPLELADGDPLQMPLRPACLQQYFQLHAMRISVTSIESPGPNDGQTLPVVYFKGTSWPLNATDSDTPVVCKGSVRLTRQGDVRWSIVVMHQGDNHWRVEGVQLGGVRSARGVVGNWFECIAEEPSERGPTAFWKATDSDVASDEIHAAFAAEFGAKYKVVWASV